MSILKATLVAAGLAIAAAVPAFAGEGDISSNDMAITFNGDGHYMSGKVTAKAMTELMKAAKPLPGGVTVMMAKGKLYLVDDPKGTLYQMARDKTMF